MRVAGTAWVDADAVEGVVWSTKELHPVVILNSGALVRAEKEANETREAAVARLARLIFGPL